MYTTIQMTKSLNIQHSFSNSLREFWEIMFLRILQQSDWNFHMFATQLSTKCDCLKSATNSGDPSAVRSGSNRLTCGRCSRWVRSHKCQLQSHLQHGCCKSNANQDPEHPNWQTEGKASQSHAVQSLSRPRTKCLAEDMPVETAHQQKHIQKAWP